MLSVELHNKIIGHYAHRTQQCIILGPFIRFIYIYFPYKQYISSKVRRGLAKVRLILEQPLTPVLR